MAELQAWRALADALEADAGPCALLAVVDSRGSSPGRPGAVMAVGVEGPLAGSIGGGAAEAGLVDAVVGQLRGQPAGRRAVAASDSPALVRLEHRAGAEGASGLVCGGWQEVLVCRLGPAALADVRRVVDALAAGLAVEWVADPDGWRVGEVRCAPVAPTAPPPVSEVGQRGGAAAHADGAGPWHVRGRSGPSHAVHVVGAGHIGRVLVPLLVDLDFRVVAIDERSGLLPVPGAHVSACVPADRLAGLVTPGPASFVTIATHAVEVDARALEAVQQLELGYLGMLGSRAKVRQLVGQRQMPPWFHAPMGLPIGSATPAEIAVSVAAELVAVRARQLGRLAPRAAPSSAQSGAPSPALPVTGLSS